MIIKIISMRDNNIFCEQLIKLISKLMNNGTLVILDFKFKNYSMELFLNISDDTIDIKFLDEFCLHEVIEGNHLDRKFSLCVYRNLYELDDIHNYIKDNHTKKDVLTDIVNNILKNINISNKISYQKELQFNDSNINCVENIFNAYECSLSITFSPLKISNVEKKLFDKTYEDLRLLANGDISSRINNDATSILKNVLIPSSNNYEYKNAYQSYDTFYKKISDEYVIFSNILFSCNDKSSEEMLLNKFIDAILNSDKKQLKIGKLADIPNQRRNFFYSLFEIESLLKKLLIRNKQEFKENFISYAPIFIGNTDKSDTSCYLSKNIDKGFLIEKQKNNSWLTLYYNENKIINIGFEDIDNSNFCYLYDNKNKSKVLEHLQTIVLNFIKINSEKNIPIKIDICDSSFINEFEYISNFSDFDFLSFRRLNHELMKTYINEVESRCKLFVGNKRNIFQLNEGLLVPKELHFVLINVKDFLKILDTKAFNFSEFFENNIRSGIYFILYGSIDNYDVNILNYHNILSFSNENIEFFTHTNNNFNKEDIKALQLVNSLNTENLSNEIHTQLNVIANNNSFLRVAIGQSVNTLKEFYFDMNADVDNKRVHAIIVGTAGSGKTTLINRIIIDVAKFYSSDEIRLILVDMKPMGVEFQMFKEHPNVEKIYLDPAIEVATLFLQDLVNEMTIRGKLFSESNVRDINQYNLESTIKMPRKILIVDEFQRIFSSDILKSMDINALLDDIARMGRAYGIHFIFLTQTLNGVRLRESVKANTKIRMAFRVASFYDTSEIFGTSNQIALSLKNRQCVYNDDFGEIDGNTVVNTYPPYSKNEMDDIFEFARKNKSFIKAEIFKQEDIQKQNEERDFENNSYMVEELNSDLMNNKKLKDTLENELKGYRVNEKNPYRDDL